MFAYDVCNVYFTLYEQALSKRGRPNKESSVTLSPEPGLRKCNKVVRSNMVQCRTQS